MLLQRVLVRHFCHHLLRLLEKLRYVPMIFLAAGFLLITIGDTIVGDSLGLSDEYTKDVVEEIVEIVGFTLVIIAVLKS